MTKPWKDPKSGQAYLGGDEDESGVATTDVTFYGDIVVIANHWKPKTKRYNRKGWMESVVLDDEEMERLITAWKNRPLKLPDSGNEESDGEA